MLVVTGWALSFPWDVLLGMEGQVLAPQLLLPGA